MSAKCWVDPVGIRCMPPGRLRVGGAKKSDGRSKAIANLAPEKSPTRRRPKLTNKRTGLHALRAPCCQLSPSEPHQLLIWFTVAHLQQHACEVHVRLQSQTGGHGYEEIPSGRLGFGDTRRRAGYVSRCDSDAAAVSRKRCVQLDQLVCWRVCWRSMDG
jgi:hypothetical protein